MKKVLISLCLAAMPGMLYSANNQSRQRLHDLDVALQNRATYDAQKQERIDSLKRLLYLSDLPYSLYHELYEEYRSYNYDTALIYTHFMQAEAERLQDEALSREADLCCSFVFLSGGLFHEAHLILSRLCDPIKSASDECLMTYARLLYDMCDYAGATPTADKYNKEGNYYLSELVARHTPADSALYWYPLSVIDLRNGNFEQGIARLEAAMHDSKISTHDKAVYASSLAYLHRKKSNTDEALKYYIDAAIYDIESSTYETVAMRMIAEILFEQGEISLADKYIHIALDDAQKYHARHRQVSVSQLLPIINQHNIAKQHRRIIITYILLLVTIILFVLSITGLLLLLHRNITIKESQQTIDNINQNLVIANKVKEELIGSYMTNNSQYLSAVEHYQQEIKNAVIKRQYNELMSIPKNADARLQRERLNRGFDEMIMRLFPNFVEKFNLLLKPDSQIETKSEELLTPALRIFALIRLGIVHNEVIAEILNYSVNTVYSYKTRTISSSPLSADEFYTALMQIS